MYLNVNVHVYIYVCTCVCCACCKWGRTHLLPGDVFGDDHLTEPAELIARHTRIHQVHDISESTVDRISIHKNPARLRVGVVVKVRVHMHIQVSFTHSGSSTK